VSYRKPFLRAGLALVATGAVLASTAARAQAPNHVHYDAVQPAADQPSPTGQLAPRLQNLGRHSFPVATRSEQGQAFISQGVNLAYGFNHAEAARAFREATRLDPDCAMAYWGHALVLGPNINAPMKPEDEPKAYELVQKAIALKPKASERERAYIDALARRYSGKADDRADRDRQYADAMRELSKRFPEDLDAAALFAEAMMDLRPWNYWLPDGTPHPGTIEVVETLESVMRRSPDHPLALHLYIHVMEPTKSPERAEVAADRLLPLMPAAGHMVHMPSHIYLRIGRYADAARANELAIVADEDYITQCRAQGLYPFTYYPHNVHFLWAAATMEGRSQVAIDAARKTARIPAPKLHEVPSLEGFVVVPYYALVRFGKWDEMLKEPEPEHAGSFLVGIRHYARGVALEATGKREDASHELARLRALGEDPAVAKLQLSSGNSVRSVLAIAAEALAGQLASRRGQPDAAIAHFGRAVRLEDSLIYTEPSDWHYPMRQALGAALRRAGRNDEAEAVYWEDLRRNPENGWSLHGLMLSLRAQGKTEMAAEIEKRFQKAWSRADVPPDWLG